MSKAGAGTFLLLVLLVAVEAAECHGKPDPNAQPNLNPIFTAPPKLVRQVTNGKLFTVGEGDDTIRIVHVWGTPYEKGFANGQLNDDVSKDMVNETWQYFESQIISVLNKTGLAPWLVDLISDVGLEIALDMTYLLTKDYTGAYFYEELKGFSDGASISYNKIRRIHQIGELTKGSCSMYGAWGSATPDGGLMQLRALDWDVGAPLKNFPQITIYHNDGSPDQGFSFANIGWTGWIGSITGVSANKIGMSEIGVSFPDGTFGKESRIGTPFTVLIRDVLQFDQTLDDAMKHISNANRTCDLILGVGDGKPSGGGFRGVEYSASVANFFTDTDMMPYNETWHPRMKDVVYYGMDWLCPPYNAKLHEQLTKYHGNITAANTIRDVVPIVQTGDLHCAVYDLPNEIIYVANARGDGETGPAMAYDRQFVRVNLTEQWSVAAPSTNIMTS